MQQQYQEKVSLKIQLGAISIYLYTLWFLLHVRLDQVIEYHVVHCEQDVIYIRKLRFEIKLVDLCVHVCVCVCVNYLSTRVNGEKFNFKTHLKFIEVVTATASPFFSSTDIWVVP